MAVSSVVAMPAGSRCSHTRASSRIRAATSRAAAAFRSAANKAHPKERARPQRALRRELRKTEPRQRDLMLGDGATERPASGKVERLRKPSVYMSARRLSVHSVRPSAIRRSPVTRRLSQRSGRRSAASRLNTCKPDLLEIKASFGVTCHDGIGKRINRQHGGLLSEGWGHQG